MHVIETKLKDCFEIEPTIYSDNRGSFFESFNKEKFKKETGLDIDFIQDNQSFSKKGVIRALHMQKGLHGQSKLVRVLQGKVLDVAVDLRKDSKTYGEYHSVILSKENNKQLFIPKGFLHGFATLEEDTIFAYKCDNYYHKDSEFGIIYNDPTLNIDWMLSEEEVILSEKDGLLQKLHLF